MHPSAIEMPTDGKDSAHETAKVGHTEQWG